MNVYFAKNQTDWIGITAQPLSVCAWSLNPAPDATAAARYDSNGLFVRLTSHAYPARAVNTEPNSPVWEDSCLEFFFSPDRIRYVNLEANARGALRASIGTGRHDRMHLLNLNVPMPTVSANVESDRWSADFFVPYSLIEALWQRIPKAGDTLFVNFYSCGDKTPHPYYAAWNPVCTPSPDFHRPEFFGELLFDEPFRFRDHPM